MITSSLASIQNSLNHGISRNVGTRLSCNLTRYQFFGTNYSATGSLKSTRLMPSRSYFCTPVRYKIKISKREKMARLEKPSTANLVNQTNVFNNVLLYKYEKEKIFKYMNIFAGIQCITLWVVGSNLYTIFRQDIFKVYENKREAFKNLLFPIGVLTLLTISGPLLCLGLWFFSARNVKYLILNKGGSKVTLVTFNPFKKISSVTLPLEKIRCQSSRYDSKGMIYLKIKGQRFYYFLDGAGEFLNPGLFDTTVGVARTFNKEI